LLISSKARALGAGGNAQDLSGKISGGIFENQTKHKQILKARNTKSIKLQPKNQQDSACRIELADLGLKCPLLKSILPLACERYVQRRDVALMM